MSNFLYKKRNLSKKMEKGVEMKKRDDDTRPYVLRVHLGSGTSVDR